MEKIASKDNLRLSLVILFSVIILTSWNNYFGKKKQEQELKKEQVITKQIENDSNRSREENKAISSNKDIVKVNLKEIQDGIAGDFLKNKSKYKNPNSQFIKDYEKSINKKLTQEEIDNLVDGKWTEDCRNLENFFERNLDLKDYKITQQLEFEVEGLMAKKNKNKKYTGEIKYNTKAFDKNLLFIDNKLFFDGSEKKDVKTIYTYSFLKKNFTEILYIDDKNELVKIDAKKIKKNHQFYLNDFFGISSNYFNFSFIKKGNSGIKVFVSENDDEYLLNLTIDKSTMDKKDNMYYQCFNIFAGGKDFNILKKYSKMFDIKKFESILDLGFFSIVAKPILILLENINKYIKNYVLSIIIITFLLKIITIPLINSSYRSTQKIKEISPKINSFKELYKDDKIKMNQAVMQLYKENKINPLSAMIPMLIQIPILFAFYKVLSGAFYLYGARGIFWIKDLSAPEGISILNLFGLLPFVVPTFLNIGPMSLLMGASTWIQQKMSSPENATDDTQKSFMYIMPVFLVFISTSFPSGLLIYWIFSNVFSILHQYLYSRLRSGKGVGRLSTRR